MREIYDDIPKEKEAMKFNGIVPQIKNVGRYYYYSRVLTPARARGAYIFPTRKRGYSGNHYCFLGGD